MRDPSTPTTPRPSTTPTPPADHSGHRRPQPDSPSSPPSEQVDYSCSPSLVSTPEASGCRRRASQPLSDKQPRTFKEALLSMLNKAEDGKPQASRPELCGVNSDATTFPSPARPGTTGNASAPPQVEMKPRLKSIVVAPIRGNSQRPRPAGARAPMASRLSFSASAHAPLAGRGGMGTAAHGWEAYRFKRQRKEAARQRLASHRVSVFR